MALNLCITEPKKQFDFLLQCLMSVNTWSWLWLRKEEGKSKPFMPFPPIVLLAIIWWCIFNLFSHALYCGNSCRDWDLVMIICLTGVATVFFFFPFTKPWPAFFLVLFAKIRGFQSIFRCCLPRFFFPLRGGMCVQLVCSLASLHPPMHGQTSALLSCRMEIDIYSQFNFFCCFR